jgi:hypothetical protein
LHAAAVAKGKLYFGSATDNGELTDAPYLAQLSNTEDFGQITPGNAQKVSQVLPCYLKPSLTITSGSQLSPLQTPSHTPKAMSLLTLLLKTAKSCDATLWFGIASCPAGVSPAILYLLQCMNTDLIGT